MRVSAGVRFNRYHRLQNYGRSPKSVLIGAWHHRVDSYPASAQLLGHVNGEHLNRALHRRISGDTIENGDEGAIA